VVGVSSPEHDIKRLNRKVFLIPLLNVIKWGKKGAIAVIYTKLLSISIPLSRIKCPIKVIAGAKDDITPPEQLFNIERYVDVSVEKVLVDAGHIGLFIKPDALKRW
jgi:pimeloyl-ACP methyl ester carboxylesterase